MASPPERITVKRRRDEEPVEALYIPPQKTRKIIVWNRVSVDDSHHEANVQISRSIGEQAQVPIVKTTPSEEDVPQPPSISPAHSQQNTVKDLARGPHEHAPSAGDFVNTLSARQSRFPTRFGKEHRKFHLATTHDSSRALSVLHGGIRKIKKKPKKKLAVFIERTDAAKKSSRTGTNDVTLNEGQRTPNETLSPPSAECSTPRKRPLASPAERSWRTMTWKQPLKSDAKAKPAAVEMHETDTVMKSDELALQLQQFALDVCATNNPASQVTRHPKVKVKPKPPKPRPARDGLGTTGEDRKGFRDSADLSDSSEDIENFVYDVYVRQSERAYENTSVGVQQSTLEKANPDKIGVLVIESEDQERWELYGNEDQSSDEDWNSEEEDENAEGYYGNDYPEDELDSDDEYDRDTYKHWHGPFDEEGCEDSIDWSDDEPIGKNGWSYR
ncbi:MAG: hypothetical protein Q9216_000331 [Gyalolechia sp. 2 TL-2023]